MYDYAIIGAGIFGSVFAFEARKKGYKCLVIDKRNGIGGNCATENINGINVHKYGAHIFHTGDREVWEYVTALTEFDIFLNSPVANYKGELYNLPFNMNTFNKLWGVITPDEAKREIERQRSIVSAPTNLEEQAISLVGTDVYEKLIKGYTEKQWGRSAKELPAFIIKRIPVRFTYDNNYFSDRYQGIPTDGYTQIFEKLLNGTEVRLNYDFFDHRAEIFSSAKKIVFTGTIDQYFDYKFGALEYRSLRFETEAVNSENYQGVAVMNFTDAETPYTRIIEHKHFYPRRVGETKNTIITREYPAIWQKGSESFYPINDDKNNALYEKYRLLADNEKNVIFGGRLAEYKYFDMWQVFRRAMDIVQVVL